MDNKTNTVANLFGFIGACQEYRAMSIDLHWEAPSVADLPGGLRDRLQDAGDRMSAMRKALTQ